MLVPPIQTLAVRSNCRPAVTEKSPSKTTFAHGPGQSLGGAYANSFGVKSANLKSLKSCTTQGLVRGRGTGGSAVAVFGDPISRSPRATLPKVMKLTVAMVLAIASHRRARECSNM